MRRVLGLDTATEDTVVAVVAGDDTIYEEVAGPREGRPLHGPSLLPMVERAVAEAGGWQALDGIAVGVGPGSFTGLRVGIATARALGRSLGIEPAGVGTLDALGAAGLERATEDRVVAAVDARRGQLFAAVYDANAKASPVIERPGEPELWDPDRIEEAFGGSDSSPVGLAVGSGALRFRDRFEAAGAVVPAPTDPVHTVSAGWIARLGGLAHRPAEPLYLRAPDAQKWIERAKRQRGDS